MAVSPDGKDLHVVIGASATARPGQGPQRHHVDGRQQPRQHPFPFHKAYGGYRRVRQGHPGLREQPSAGRGRPGDPGPGSRLAVLQPGPGPEHPAGSLANVPFVADALNNPGGDHLKCAKLPKLQVGLPAHSAPLGMTFLEGSKIPAPWSGGAVMGVHGSWNRNPPRAPAVLWMAWNAAKHALKPAIALITGFQNADGSRWGRASTPLRVLTARSTSATTRPAPFIASCRPSNRPGGGQAAADPAAARSAAVQERAVEHPQGGHGRAVSRSPKESCCSPAYSRSRHGSGRRAVSPGGAGRGSPPAGRSRPP